MVPHSKLKLTWLLLHVFIIPLPRRRNKKGELPPFLEFSIPVQEESNSKEKTQKGKSQGESLLFFSELLKEAKEVGRYFLHFSKMNGGPSGFQNAPVTKTFVIACGLLSIFVGMQGRSSGLGLSYQDSFKRLKFWRLFASVFAFSSTPELMFGLYLLYYFRVFERQIGSNKYSVFIIQSLVVSSLFQLLGLGLFKVPSLNILASGPYGLIFSSFIPFYFDIPVSTRFRIFGIHFSDKSFIYMAGLQLLLSTWKRSLLPGICGILAGFLYRLNIFGIRRMKFPVFVSSFFARLSWPTTGGSSRTASNRNLTGNVPSHRAREVEVNHPSTAPLAFTVEPPEDSIATLVSMGFERNSARQALVQARNDMNTATNILLESQSH